MHFKEEIAIIEKKFIAKITTPRDDIGITTQAIDSQCDESHTSFEETK